MPKRDDLKAAMSESLAAGEKASGTEHPLRPILKDENEARVLLIPTDHVEPNPDQPRKTFSPQAHDDLTASVREKGILQPLIARRHPTNPDRCILIAGERRWRAAKAAGLEKVPVLLRTPEDSLEVAIIENLQREDLPPLEEAEALRQLKEAKGYTLEELGRMIGKSKQSVSEALKILDLPETIRNDLRASTDVRTLPKSQMLELVRAGTPQQIDAAWDALKRGEATTVRDLRQRKESSTGRPKPYTFTYKPKDGRFRLTVAFTKSRVTAQEVKGALKDATRHLR